MERIRTTLVYVLLTLVTAVALFPIGYMLLIAGYEQSSYMMILDDLVVYHHCFVDPHRYGIVCLICFVFA